MTMVYEIYSESYAGGFRAGSAEAMTAVLVAIIFGDDAPVARGEERIPIAGCWPTLPWC